MLGDKIMHHRKKAGWTQEEFAEKLNVSRQSVSKWEGNQSIPDVNKLLQISELFGVSVDYLLKEALVEPEFLEGEEDTGIRQVSLEETNQYIEISEKAAKKIGLGVSLCILSPTALMFLIAASENRWLNLSSNFAVGIGMVFLLMMVAAGVSLFVSVGAQLRQYEFLENEVFETQYGVRQLIEDKRAKYQSTYTKSLIVGIVLCILAAIPLISLILADSEATLALLGVVFLLMMVSAGVYLLVSSGSRWSSYEKILQEGEYSKKKKANKKMTDAIFGSYWLLVVAIYLGYSFFTMNWERSWIIFPVAGVSFGVLAMLVSLFEKEK
ncbi:helix-turn-helix domain-containing protein [Enterococcus lemanii]|uniref:Helix-turn-helix domain-containing protein n=1 Tax=Enterococcus lemanii TaxID=1159752 RepID=A0ABV9MY65_9ENTE|nr:helix-turn-helix transcriptional regulator [Enterococcus lemanii]MBM7708243.1 transcriptional regulator with XRE-family HTH domain/multisubunit Na+/H+ antiporter MnhG subunit [Enterococcus lemanii]